MGVDTDIKAMAERDIAFATGNISAVLSFNSQTIIGTHGPDMDTHVVELEGEYFTKEFEFVAKYSDFSGGTLPGQRETVEIDGEKVFVQDVNENGVHVVLTLRRDT
jgi:hypothetical protein